jgi:hypothetical protein
MATTIKLKNGSGAPLAGDLVQGEPALDLTNKRLYTEDSGGTVIEVGTNPTSLTTGTFTSTGIDDNATSTAITIDSSENVGIGTVSPSEQLHIANANDAVVLVESTGSDATDDANIQLKTTNGTFTFQNDRSIGTTGALTIAGATSNNIVVDHTSGNVGIGTASPVNTSADYGDLTLNGTTGGFVNFTDNDVLSGRIGSVLTSVQLASASGNIEFRTGGIASGDEAMRIDSSGNLLVGKTSTSNATTTVGHLLNADGVAVHTRDADTPLRVSRLTDDGDIVSFHKDSTTVGSIGTQNGSDFFIGSPPATIGLRFQTNEIVPVTHLAANNDAAIDLGKSNIRFKDLYLSGGAYLGGTAAANHLDDYEEGTFTPTLSGGGTAGTTTYSIQSGKYTKVGRMVHVTLNISYTSATGTGSYNIGGLPFTSANIDQNYAVGSIIPSGLNWTGGTSLLPLQFQNTNYIIPYYVSDDGSSDSQQMVNESANFRLSLTYYTS